MERRKAVPYKFANKRMDQGPSVREGLAPPATRPNVERHKAVPYNSANWRMDQGPSVRRGFTPSADIYLGLEKGLENRERVLLFNLAPGSKKPDSRTESGLRKENQYVNISRIQERNPAYEKKISSLYVYTSPIEPYLLRSGAGEAQSGLRKENQPIKTLTL